MRRLAAVLCALGLLVAAGACAKSTAADNQPPRCADLVAHAFASTEVVPGAFACFSSDIQKSAAAAGVASDADLATLGAQPPVYTAYAYKFKRVDQGVPYYYFEFSPGPRCAHFHIDSDGHVDDGSWSQQGVGCPAT